VTVGRAGPTIQCLTPLPPSNRLIPWPWRLLALALAAAPLAGMLQLETPGSSALRGKRCLEQCPFWGGNPNEVFSHWLDMCVMSGTAAVLSALVAIEVSIRARHAGAARFVRAHALLAFMLGAAGGLVLDVLHGEGGALIVYSIFFGPVLLTSYRVLRRLAALARGLGAGPVRGARGPAADRAVPV
jgi:hypothetical protein